MVISIKQPFLVLLLLASCSSAFSNGEPVMNDSVSRILAQPGERYPGQFSDQLSALGSNAVPAITSSMLNDNKYYVTYIDALHRIGDKAAIPALFQLVEKLSSDDHEHVGVQIEGLIAIRDLGDRSSVPSLAAIMSESRNPISLRLTAAATIAHHDDGQALDDARSFIDETYSARQQYFRQ